MAKKNNGLSDFDNGKNSLFNLLNTVDGSAEILSDSKIAKISSYINTGWYILNAALTGSIFKGVPNNKIITLNGESGCGKSYLAINICREAQKEGYTPIYLDSEGAMDIDFVKRLGCDPTRFYIRPVTTVKETATFIAKFTKAMSEQPENEREKVIIVLDSLGNLTSEKELRDTIEGNDKSDMTRAKEIKALFRTNTTALSKLGIPMIVCNHIYYSQDFIPQAVIGGGSGIVYVGSVNLMMSTAKLDDKESDKIANKKVGDFVKTGVIVSAKAKKSRFTIPQKVRFAIPFFKKPNPYGGLEAYLSWDNSGIIAGEILDQKGYDKLSPAEKELCHEMTDEKGNVCFAHEKQTSRKIVVKHLHKELPKEQLYTPEVFTDEILHSLDENVIRPNFELPSSEVDFETPDMFDEE